MDFSLAITYGNCGAVGRVSVSITEGFKSLSLLVCCPKGGGKCLALQQTGWIGEREAFVNCLGCQNDAKKYTIKVQSIHHCSNANDENHASYAN